MALASEHFKNNARLNSTLVSDPAHVTEGQSGEHVRLIQEALQVIDKAAIAQGELATQTYGKSTAAAVLAYKTKRGIINRTYQNTADSIVGKMTIAALDRDMLERQRTSGQGARCVEPRPNFSLSDLSSPIPEKVPLEIASLWDAHDAKNRQA